MMKKILAMLIAGLMMLSMVACDLGNTEDPNKDNPGVSQNGGENNNGGGDNGNTPADGSTVKKIKWSDYSWLSVLPEYTGSYSGAEAKHTPLEKKEARGFILQDVKEDEAVAWLYSVAQQYNESTDEEEIREGERLYIDDEYGKDLIECWFVPSKSRVAFYVYNYNVADADTISAMEAKIAGYLSAIGGPSTIEIVDGNYVEYTPPSEWGFAVDVWEIHGITKTWAEIEQSLNDQLTPLGFSSGVALLGKSWYVKAGVEQLGFSVSVEGNKATIMMTHRPENYSAAYIQQMEAQMPDIISGTTALDIMPKNFMVEYQIGDSRIVKVIRLNDSWCFETTYLDDNGNRTNSYPTVYLLQDDGSYRKYSKNYKGNWSDDGLTTIDKLDESIDDVFDKEGWDDNGTLSTWLQMCKDFEDDAGTFGSANSRFSFSESMVKTGTETVGGVNCAVVTTDGWFTDMKYVYDPTTGVMFKITKTEQEKETVMFEVLSYSTNPTSLGDFVQP